MDDPEPKTKPSPELDDVEQSKLDACIDRFLIRVAEIHNIKDMPRLPDLKSLGDQKKELAMLTAELSENLNRLLSKGFENDALDDGDINDRLGERLETLSNKGQLNVQVTGYVAPRMSAYYSQIVDPIFTYFCQQLDGTLKDTNKVAHQSVLMTVREQLESKITGRQASASFVCGGAIVVQSGHSPTNVSVSPPVTIFWRLEQDNTALHLALPLRHNTNSESAFEALQNLVHDCAPASFGMGEKEVLDPQYRQAGKLEPQQFKCSFHPSDFGIIENVEQILLPSLYGEGESRRLKAELYKLNVYSGPSGLFQKHVDTPRSNDQIGSLVICLPSPFKGGSLIVRHQGQEVRFDWSQQSGSTVQWAAFYSDCEHEIETVTEGHRITLTYNLYASGPTGVGQSVPASLILDPKSLPLHGALKEVLMKSDFLRMGGILGLYCSHAYPYTSPHFSNILPKALKGADLEVYSLFKYFGMQARVRPVFNSGSGELAFAQRWQTCEEDYQEFLSSFPIDSSDLDLYWKFILFSRRMNGFAEVCKYAKQEKLKVSLRDSSEGYLIRADLEPFQYADESEQWAGMHEILECTRKCESLPGLIWLGDPKNEEADFAFVAYGNESSIGVFYSFAAIIVDIPPFHIRQRLAVGGSW